jgi:hypothetical protein
MVPGKREEGGEEGKGGRRKGKKDDAEGKEAQTPSFLPSSLHPFPPFFLLLPFPPWHIFRTVDQKTLNYARRTVDCYFEGSH